MEERAGLRGAIGIAWGNLTGINNEGRAVRLLFFLIFLSGTAWAVWSYWQGMELVELGMAHAIPAGDPAQADHTRLTAMIQQVETTSHMRMGSMERVRIIEEHFALYPFREPTQEVFVVSLPDEVIPIEVPIVLPDPPPNMTLRGIMIMGNQQVAVMDISGVGDSMIIRAGDTFMQRRGRVVRIAPDRVVVNWEGRNWDIAPSF
jgi:hypothetical protein